MRIIREAVHSVRDPLVIKRAQSLQALEDFRARVTQEEEQVAALDDAIKEMDAWLEANPEE